MSMTKTRTSTRTNPRVIREALALADESTCYQAGKALGICHRTIWRWTMRREQHGDIWPTEADIATWEAEDAERRDLRERRATQAREYRKRVYLNRGPLSVPSRGTTRRLQALYALGWTAREMGERLGVSSARVGHMMNGAWAFVLPSTARAVDELYRSLNMVVPTDRAPSRRGEVRVHQRARRDAQRRGYAPPLAWDDIDHDAHPHGTEPARRTYTVDELCAEWDHLRRLGFSMDTAATALGLSRGAIERAVARQEAAA